jgi:hypothetical protein
MVAAAVLRPDVRAARAGVLLLLCCVLACGDTPIEREIVASPGVRVEEVGRVRLGARPGLAVARPISVEVDAAGSIYVADAFHDAVFIFSPAGDLVQVVQQRDSDQGKTFKVGGFLGTFGDGVLVFDYFGRRIAVASRASEGPQVLGHFAGRLSAGRIDSEGLWVGIVDLAKGLAMAHLPSVTAMPDTLRADRLAVPAEYAEGEMLAAVYDWMKHTRIADTLIVGFSGLNDVIIADTGGTVHSRRSVPVALRRGVPAEMHGAMASGDVRFPDAIGGMSALFALEQLSGRRVGIVHVDQTVEAKLYRAEAVWLSILDADLRNACVDMRIPIPAGQTPAVGFRGDTVITIQVSLDSGGSPYAELRKFTADPSRCAWAELR